MNKKVLGVALAFVFLAAMATPMALATPGDEKNNEKFEYFELVCSGTGDGSPDKEVITMNPHILEYDSTVPEEDAVPKTLHTRGSGWVTGDIVELTVGDETFDMDSDPYSVDWTTTVNVDAIWNNDGSLNRYIVRLTDVVTVYEGVEEIGTLVLELKASIVPGRDPLYSGSLVGHGTDALKGVHISGVDVGQVGPQLFLRTGTITGWPEDITNT